jgi:hypothetical protein
MRVFCANCKSYEDAMSAGYGRKVKQNSAQFKCTANHTDFMFPTDKLLDDIDDIKRKSVSVEDVSCDEESAAESQTSMNTEDELLKDLMVYTGALVQCESVSWAKLNEQSEQFQYILWQQEDQLAAEASAANDLKAELSMLHDMVDIQRKQIDNNRKKCQSYPII